MYLSSSNPFSYRLLKPSINRVFSFIHYPSLRHMHIYMYTLIQFLLLDPCLQLWHNFCKFFYCLYSKHVPLGYTYDPKSYSQHVWTANCEHHRLLTISALGSQYKIWRSHEHSWTVTGSAQINAILSPGGKTADYHLGLVILQVFWEGRSLTNLSDTESRLFM